MSDAKQGADEGSFLKTALVLWVLSLVGMFLVLPYATTLEGKALAAAVARTHLPMSELLALSLIQSVVLLAVAVVAGLWAGRKLGLETPLLAALLTSRPAPKGTIPTLLLAVLLGVAPALAVANFDHLVFARIPSVAVLIHNAQTGSARPSAWKGLLACFYGALDEEILMRLGLLTLLALALRTLARALGADRNEALPTGVFWTANFATAVTFGLGHLLATAALAPLSTALVVRAIVLNGLVGVIFGALYRRYGLEWAMVSHFAVDIVLHVFLA